MTADWRGASAQQPDRREAPIHVHNCGRIGMRANPPRRQLRLLRRRR